MKLKFNEENTTGICGFCGNEIKPELWMDGDTITIIFRCDSCEEEYMCRNELDEFIQTEEGSMEHLEISKKQREMEL